MAGRRDDFTETVKSALCDRVGGRCSKPECRAFTKGPSLTPAKATSIGHAAHIHAAAAGGPRYLATQTADERRGFENGIWLCANHAAQVDADESAFTAEELRRWKSEAEEFASRMIGKAMPLSTGAEAPRGLVSIGPNVIAAGRLLRSASRHWTLALDEFVLGDVATLRTFADAFEGLPHEDCFVCVEAEGIGRMLIEGPTIDLTNGVQVELHVAAPVPPHEARARFDVNQRGATLPLDLSGDEPDLDVSGREVSGVDTIAQTLVVLLGTCKGGYTIGSDEGSRVAEFAEKLGEARVPSIVALETIRLATAPFEDRFSKKTCVALDFVERVRGVRLLPTQSREFVKAGITLDVYGLREPCEFRGSDFAVDGVARPSTAADVDRSMRCPGCFTRLNVRRPHAPSEHSAWLNGEQATTDDLEFMVGSRVDRRFDGEVRLPCLVAHERAQRPLRAKNTRANLPKPLGARQLVFEEHLHNGDFRSGVAPRRHPVPSSRMRFIYEPYARGCATGFLGAWRRSSIPAQNARFATLGVAFEPSARKLGSPKRSSPRRSV